MDALVNEFPRYVEGFIGTLRISLFAAISVAIQKATTQATVIAVKSLAARVRGGPSRVSV